MTGKRTRWFGRQRGAGWLGLAALALGAVGLAPVLRADDPGPGAQAARLSSVDGQVRISQGGQPLADQAVANVPLFEGTQVATGNDGKAEIQFDDGSVARISPDSAVTLTVLRGTGEIEIVLEGGLAYFELQGKGQGAQMRIRFGDSVVTASGFTVLRIRMDTPPGEVAVFSGNAHLERGSALALDLRGGESVALNGADPSHYDLDETIEPDSWDAWNSDRDQALTAEAAAQTGTAGNFVNSENPAWNDLDANGNWYNVPGEGYVWSPYEAAGAGWDPYGNGNWMWTPGYGYIWGSGYSWGYMPYQCGLWNYYDSFGWGWAPGMGRCRPWWRGGYYRGVNIGHAPANYRLTRRPNMGLPGGRNPHPIVAVNRRSMGGTGGLPARDRNAPVVIAGHTVQALHPQPSRPAYGRPGSGFVSGGTTSYQGGRTAGAPPNGARSGNVVGHPGYIVTPAPRNTGGQGNAQPGRSYTPPARTYTPPARTYTPPSGGASGGSQPSHSSGGGSYSGGGGSHPSSSGGSSGGGGGSHSGGGGGHH